MKGAFIAVAFCATSLLADESFGGIGLMVQEKNDGLLAWTFDDM